MPTDPAPLPGEPRPDPFPSIKGRCPACGWKGLFIGSGGWITCPQYDCPNPTMVADWQDEGWPVAQAQRVVVLESLVPLAIEAAEVAYCGWCEDYAPDDCRFLKHDPECPHGRLIAAVLVDYAAEAREAVPPTEDGGA